MKDSENGEAPYRPHQTGDHELLIDLAEALGSTGTTTQMAQSALAVIVGSFSASSGHVSCVESDEDGDLVLASVAHVGPHSSFLGDTPAVSVAAGTDASDVFRTGSPVFLGNVYDSAFQPETNGAARWREQLGAQARAVIPVEASGRRLGTLALDWSAPREFEHAEQRTLEAAASLLALGLMQATDARDAVPVAQPGLVTVLEVTPEGVVTSPRSEHVSEAASLRITARAGQWAVVDVYTVAPDRVLMLAASVMRADSDPDPELIETLRHTARVLCARETPEEAASALSARITEMAPAWTALDAWIGVWSPATGVLEHAVLGLGHARLLLTDGRLMSAGSGHVSDLAGATEHTGIWLPLPGDVLHAWTPGDADMRVEWLTGRPTGRRVGAR